MSVNMKVTHHLDPALEFGEGEAATPKTGLADFGPYSLRLGDGHRDQLHLAIVGTAATIRSAKGFLDRMRTGVRSGNSNLALFPDFPGFDQAFRSELRMDAESVIGDGKLQGALGRRPREAFTATVDLFADAVSSLTERDVRPDLVICALPREVTDRCRRIDQPLPRAEMLAARREEERRSAGQGSLFEMDGFDSIEQAADPRTEDLLSRDFRLALKARAMQARMPIQLMTEGAWEDGRSNQDPATRAWNLGVALFYKAGGIPWRARPRTEETCFVGVSFHHLRTTRHHYVYSSVAQAFSSDGEGFALRGEAEPWDARTRQTHMSAEQAETLFAGVLESYRERAGRDPLRLVVHKTSVYTEEEREGIGRALSSVPAVELLTLRSGDFRLVRQGSYPPHRGTACWLGDARFLFTVGYMPAHLTYPGPHIPVPLEVLGAEENFEGAVEDLLALSKMNWNSAASFAALPISLSFARLVGGVMAEIPPGSSPHPSFRFYM
jgi:hypothetical protein